MSPTTFVLLALAAFAAMEPVTYLVHRFVMHGPGMAWHRSHHRTRRTTFERNDLFPVVFATLTFSVMAVGAAFEALRFLLPIGTGVTAYGMTYLVVHDLLIHRRIPVLARHASARRLAAAHAVHHRAGGEPYGMLLPVVPRSRRDLSAPTASAPPV